MLQSRSYHSNLILSVILASIVLLFMLTFISMDFLHLLSALIIPLIFLIISGVFVRESVYFLIAPLILYFSDRVYIFLMNGLYALDLIANDPTIGFAGFSFYVINLLRTILAIGIATYGVYTISAKSDKSWRLLHRWVGILLVIQGVEYLFGISYFPSSVLELLFAPGTLYFPIIMFTLTHPKWYVLDFEKSFIEKPMSFQQSNVQSAPHGHPYSSQAGHASWQPSDQHSHQEIPYVTANTGAKVICPHCQTENRATDNFCKKCGQSIKSHSSQAQQKPSPNARPVKPQASYQKPTAILHVCPECQSENIQNSPYCLSCGHNLKK